MKIIDISPLVTEASPVYPGDAPLTLQFAQSSQARIGTLTMSAHLGAHVDAPLHLNRLGDISEIEPQELIGPCQVVEIIGQRVIRAEDIPVITRERVLIKTGFRVPDQWTADFASLAPEAVRYLLNCGVRVIGIDTPSIDRVDDEKLQSHVLAIDAGALILENLDLSTVTEGDYQLIALPLKIRGLEASPVRAVLIDSKES